MWHFSLLPYVLNNQLFKFGRMSHVDYCKCVRRYRPAITGKYNLADPKAWSSICWLNRKDYKACSPGQDPHTRVILMYISGKHSCSAVVVERRFGHSGFPIICWSQENSLSFLDFGFIICSKGLILLLQVYKAFLGVSAQ